MNNSAKTFEVLGANSEGFKIAQFPAAIACAIGAKAT